MRASILVTRTRIVVDGYTIQILQDHAIASFVVDGEALLALRRRLDELLDPVSPESHGVRRGS